MQLVGGARGFEAEEVTVVDGHRPRRAEHGRHELPLALLDQVDAELSRLDRPAR